MQTLDLDSYDTMEWLCSNNAMDIIDYLIETKNIELSDALKENLEDKSTQNPTCLDVLQCIEKRDLHVFVSKNLKYDKAYVLF